MPVYSLFDARMVRPESFWILSSIEKADLYEVNCIKHVQQIGEKRGALER
jgi:hypothetical protein